MARPTADEILKDAELISILGEINLEWDEIEFGLWYLFDVLLNVHWSLSYSVFFSQQNHRARRDMIEALAPNALRGNQSRLKAINALLSRVKRAAKKRNEVTHGLWNEIPVAGGKEFRRMPIKRDYAAQTDMYSKSDLKRLRDQVLKLNSDLYEFAHPPWKKKNP
jgi:hypothetical protein